MNELMMLTIERYHALSDHGRDGAPMDSFTCNCREVYEALGEDMLDRFVDAPDPETEPDPDFAGMFFAEIDEELYQIEYDERQSYADWEYANRMWFLDHRISHG